MAGFSLRGETLQAPLCLFIFEMHIDKLTHHVRRNEGNAAFVNAATLCVISLEIGAYLHINGRKASVFGVRRGK